MQSWQKNNSMNAKYLILFFLILSCFFCENQKEDSPAKKMLTDPTYPLFYFYWVGYTQRTQSPQCGNSDFIGQVLGFYNNLRIINLQVDTTYNVDTSIVNTRGFRMFQGSPNTNYQLDVTLNGYIVPQTAGFTLQDCQSKPITVQLYYCNQGKDITLFSTNSLSLSSGVSYPFSGANLYGTGVIHPQCNLQYTLRISTR